MAGRRSKSKALAKKPELLPEHVNQVFEWILAGATEHDVKDSVATEYPGTDPMPLIVAAITRFQEAGAFDEQTARGWCFEAYRDLYRRMVECGDFTGALQAVRLISALTRT
jgi:hypothetical protein